MKLLRALVVCSLTALVACSSSTPPPTSVVAPPSGTIVFVREHQNDESLVTIHADGTGEKQLLTTPRGPARWSHKGGRLLVAAFGLTQSNLITTATVRADGSGYTVLPLATPGLNLGPGVWSPDDGRIAFEGWDDSEPSRNGVYSADAADGRNLRRVTTNAEQMDEVPVSYSPDGSTILVWRGPFSEEPGQLFLVGANGGDPILLSPPGMTVRINSSNPGGWSPDGAHIVFAAHSPTSSNPFRSAVFVANGDGTNPKRISDWGKGATTARWSPKGDWIAYDNINAGDQRSFFLIHPDGSGSKVMGSLPGVCCVVWSPEGNRLLFARGPSVDASDLWTAQLDGTHLTQLTHTPATLSSIGGAVRRRSQPTLRQPRSLRVPTVFLTAF